MGRTLDASQRESLSFKEVLHLCVSPAFDLSPNFLSDPQRQTRKSPEGSHARLYNKFISTFYHCVFSWPIENRRLSLTC